MATRDDLRRRVRAFAEQLHAEFGDFSVDDETCWLAGVEDIAAELGDAMATALVEQQSLPHVDETEPSCPKCGKPGRPKGTRERELITKRGPVTISEPEFYCPCCRKAFFPDGRSDRR